MQGKSTGIRALTLAGALAALGLTLGAAAPAEAGRFGDGFEDELGRIAAHAAVGAGVHLLHHATGPHYVETHVVHHGYRPYGPRPHYRRHHHRPHWKHRGHGHGRHYGHHDRHRGHGYGGPCEVEHRVSYERHESYARY